MLKKFAVTNFRGFADRITWNLDNPGNYEFNAFAVQDGLVKNGIIYGKNGSGKSNLGLAVFDIVNHISHKWKKADYYEYFTYAGAINKPVTFEYSFRLGNKDVDYVYSKVKDGRLIEEKLVVDGQQVFYMKSKVSFEIDEKQFPIENSLKAGLKDNANNISIVNFLITSFPLAEGHYLLQLQSFVENMLWFRCLDVKEFIGFESGITFIEQYIIKKHLIDDFSSFVKDVSGQEFVFVNPSPSPDVLYCQIGNEQVLFNKIASTGTRSLELFYLWLKKTLDKASFVFIDEFDAFYHYELSYGVCQHLFKLPCQAFVTTHNTYLMTNDLLRPDCYFYIKNNQINALCDLTDKELRQANNIEKLYRGGSFES